MKARVIKGLIDTGSAARDYIRLVCGGRQSPVKRVNEAKPREGAAEVLEAFRNHRRQQDSGYILTGKRVITAMDEQLRGYSSAGERFADWITKGCRVSISGDDRPFTVMAIWWDDEAIKVKDDQGHTYLVPFKIIGPWPKESDE